MPLRDHFRPPIHPRHRWESFHSNWATRIADALAELLPPGFQVEEYTYGGSRMEIDVAAIEDPLAAPHRGHDVATLESRTYAPPAPTATVPAAFGDSYEVRVFEAAGGLTLVGVVELVSPANKDRPEERRAFAAKTAGYLAQGVSVVIADIVTGRRANLHNETVALLGPAAALASFPGDVPLYAAAYRPVSRDGGAQIEIWTEPLRLGNTLPTVPLRLTGDLFVPVDLEASYSEACRRRGIA